jgi:hypothetical protein
VAAPLWQQGAAGSGLTPFSLKPGGSGNAGRPKGQPTLLKRDDSADGGYEYGIKFDGKGLTSQWNDDARKKNMPPGMMSKRLKQGNLTPQALETGATGRRTGISKGFGSRITKGRY